MDVATFLWNCVGGGGGLRYGWVEVRRALLQVAVLPADRGVGRVTAGSTVAVWVPAIVPLQIPGQEVKDIGSLRSPQQQQQQQQRAQADPLALRLVPIMVNSKWIAFIHAFIQSTLHCLTFTHSHTADNSVIQRFLGVLLI